MMIITIGLYFEVRDAEMYGGVGTVGYANVNLECALESLTNEKLKNYVNSQIEGIANLCKTSVEKVKVISRTEYEENVDDD